MSRSRKILWALAGLVVAVVAITSFGGIPSAADLLSGAESSRAEAQQLNAQAQRADAALAQEEQFAQDLAVARAAVPPTPQLSELISDLEAQAAAAGLAWLSGAPARTIRDEEEQWQIAMTVSGPPTAVAQFTGDLRQAPRLFIVDGLSMQNNSDGVVTALMTVRFYTTLGEIDSFPAEERAAIRAAQPALDDEDEDEEQ